MPGLPDVRCSLAGVILTCNLPAWLLETGATLMSLLLPLLELCVYVGLGNPCSNGRSIIREELCSAASQIACKQQTWTVQLPGKLA